MQSIHIAELFWSDLSHNLLYFGQNVTKNYEK